MRLAVCCLALGTFGSAAIAQGSEQIPVNVEIRVSKRDADTVTDSHTHLLFVTANRTGRTEVRLGNEVPVSEQYRNVGTKIQCRVETRDDQFQLWLDLERSEPASTMGPPTFNTFSTHHQVLIDAGRRTELVRIAHPDTDETWTLEVTLTRAP